MMALAAAGDKDLPGFPHHARKQPAPDFPG